MRTKYACLQAVRESIEAVTLFQNKSSLPADKQESDELASTASSGPGGAGKRKHTLGSAPPIENFMELLYIGSLASIPDGVYELKLKEEQDQFVKAFLAKLQPIRDLLKALSGDLKEARNRLKKKQLGESGKLDPKSKAMQIPIFQALESGEITIGLQKVHQLENFESCWEVNFMYFPKWMLVYLGVLAVNLARSPLQLLATLKHGKVLWRMV